MPLSSLQPITARIKQPEVVKALGELILELGPEGKFPRVRELARALGVSLATLDQGLRQLEERGQIVRKGRTGIFVTTQAQTKRIGLVLGGNIFTTQGDYFYRLLLDSCASRAVSLGQRYSVFFDLPGFSGGPSEVPFAHDDLVFALDSGRLDGLIHTFSPGREEEAWLWKQNVPMVALSDSGLPGTVQIDEEYLLRLAAGALHAEGCRSLGLIAGVGADYRDYFQKVVSEMGFQTKPSWIFAEVRPKESESFEEFGRKVAESFLTQNSGNLPDGLIIMNDIVGRGVCQTLAAAGIGLGTQLKVASHANRHSPVLSEWEPHLILCEIDPAEVAEMLFEQLDRLMAGEPLTQPVVRIRPHLKTPFPHLAQLSAVADR